MSGFGEKRMIFATWKVSRIIFFHFSRTEDVRVAVNRSSISLEVVHARHRIQEQQQQHRNQRKRRRKVRKVKQSCWFCQEEVLELWIVRSRSYSWALSENHFTTKKLFCLSEIDQITYNISHQEWYMICFSSPSSLELDGHENKHDLAALIIDFDVYLRFNSTLLCTISQKNYWQPNQPDVSLLNLVFIPEGTAKILWGRILCMQRIEARRKILMISLQRMWHHHLHHQCRVSISYPIYSMLV